MSFIDHGLNHRKCIKNASKWRFPRSWGYPQPSSKSWPNQKVTWNGDAWGSTWERPHFSNSDPPSIAMENASFTSRMLLPLEQHVIFIYFMWCSIANCQITRGSPMTQPILDRYLCVMECQWFSKTSVNIPIQRRKGTLLKPSQPPDTNVRSLYKDVKQLHLSSLGIHNWICSLSL